MVLKDGEKLRCPKCGCKQSSKKGQMGVRTFTWT